MIRYFFTVFFLAGLISPALAQEPAPACTGADRACLLQELETTAAAITEEKWRDIAYRELAKSYARENRLTDAVTQIDKISHPDTKAMTIRGIGMAAAELALSEGQYKELFASLAEKAAAIAHEPSRDIAYTYISMSQAFARQDEAALATAATLKNDALRHKAYGEMAEIQAERKEPAGALATLARIDSEAYRNKATRSVVLILADQGLKDDASRAAHGMTNPTLKAEALQHILEAQTKPAAGTGKP